MDDEILYMQKEVSVFHLRLVEYLSGDREVEVDALWQMIDRADERVLLYSKRIEKDYFKTAR